MKEKQAKSASSKKGFIIIAVLLVAVIAVAAVAYNALAPTVSQEGDQVAVVGDVGSGPQADGSGGTADRGERVEAPDFTVVDGEGTSISLSQFRGKPVVLNFWASTCGPCQQEMPEFQNAFDIYGDDVAFMMVNVVGFNGETEDRAQRFIAENSYTFPVLFDSEEDASMQYGVTSIPRTFFIDREGYVVATASGMINGASLEQGIKMILR